MSWLADKEQIDMEADYWAKQELKENNKEVDEDMAEAAKKNNSLVNANNQLQQFNKDVLPQDYNKRIEEAKRQNGALMALMNELLEEGTDYGKEKGIPKPFLHQPGAQQLMLVFKITQEFEIINKEIEFNQDPTFISYDVKCKLKQRDSGQFLGEGVGSCNNYEEKYKYRWKYDDNGKKYRTTYEDPLDNMNTLLKMAKKRAMVDAVLNVTGAARLFTQDQDYVKNHKDYNNSNKSNNNNSYSKKKKSKEVNVDTPENVVIPSGKYEGKTVEEAPDYFLNWVMENMKDNEKWAKVYTAAKMYLENKEEQSEEQSKKKTTRQKVEEKRKENQLSEREKEVKKLIGDDKNLKEALLAALSATNSKSIDDMGEKDYQVLIETLKEEINVSDGEDLASEADEAIDIDPDDFDTPF